MGDFPDRQVSQLYGVLSDRGYSRRTTFLIDKLGVIQRIDSGRDAMDVSGIKSACAKLK